MGERLILGVGLSSGADAQALLALALAVLDEGERKAAELASIVSLERRIGHPALRALAMALDCPLLGYPAERLAGARVPTPSMRVEELVGVASVAEAAALEAAGRGALLLVGKRRASHLTCALAHGDGIDPEDGFSSGPRN
ncbi:cobalt-precorrin 5A hydrolase/sirohydrochlorin cobaltochelatase/cobalt-precorrin 5A hydrolase / precorrin-3B C17-methyltransferase [Arboricoccus pini]|uniref:Cobalt-precorrin 5A hydrolase/sirohydrochlorin cobaltochelatase/cobalt-precorrin 5A hydrolase / precorrin-3B C17-methyltransferase n=1 Tax=Arboricoccus pini TaxID=1963835 RepID=A0A212QRN5_9PROT|nr:cobalamin biosynthesis protein [Arboricoccus pini]SNB62203.1 cobalt-precorrin 5A hydrolase/sirohydrochlorin cobaltochelatase/cobalt-precorrin 5A hydrolase / precorrin-3B C17-methyltransferase [Arboricoccus pini]